MDNWFSIPSQPWWLLYQDEKKKRSHTPSASSKLCHNWLRHLWGTFYSRVAVHRRCQRPPKGWVLVCVCKRVSVYVSECVCVCCTHLFSIFSCSFCFSWWSFSGFSLFFVLEMRTILCFCFCCCLFLFVVCICILCLLQCLTRCSFIDVLSVIPLTILRVARVPLHSSYRLFSAFGLENRETLTIHNTTSHSQPAASLK